MDKTETYIKQCEQATKIQTIKPDSSTDYLHGWFACGKCYEVCHEDDGYYYGYCDCNREVWLPRQDELQEMIPLKMSASWLFLDAFIRDYMETIDESYDFPSWDSWEQLWLAFVMKEKYNKTWNGEDWISPLK